MCAQPITNANAAHSLLKLLIRNQSDFLFRRFYQEAEKAYRANPNDLFSCFLFGQAEAMRDINGSDIIFKDLVISKLNNHEPEQLRKEIYCYYAALLYYQQKYIEALEAFDKGYSFEELALTTTSLFSGLGIYFENDKYQEIINTSEELLKNNDILENKTLINLESKLLQINIYQAFSFYELGNISKSLEVLDTIMNNLNFKPLSNSNINDFIELLKKMIVNPIFKPTISDKEESCLKNIKELLDFYSKSEETIEIISDEELMKKINSSISKIDSNDTLSWEEAEAALGW